MTVSEKVLTALRRAYQLWDESQGNDVKPLMDLMAEDVQLTTLPDGSSPLEFSRSCHSKAELDRYFEGLIGNWELLGGIIEDIVCERDRVVVLLDTQWRNRRTSKEFVSAAVHSWRFRNGKAVHIRLYFDTAKWSAAAQDESS